MSLITVCQTALKEIGNTEVPSSFVGNQNVTAVQILALANRSLKEAAKRVGWKEVSRKESITTVAGTADYALPSDYKRMTNQTMWNTTQRRRVTAVSAQEWALLHSWSNTDTVSQFYRIFRDPSGNGQKVQFYPEPGEAQTITYEYISFGLTQSSGGVLQGDTFLADTDTALLDEDLVTLGLKWRYLQSKGLPYSEELQDYERAVAYEGSADGSPIISMGTDNIAQQRVFAVPDGNYGS